MTTKFKVSNGMALSLGVTLVLALIAALMSARQFVGWPLNATELDFVIMNRVLAMRDAFEGTVYVALAENVSRLSILPTFIGLLEVGGVVVERQVVYLNIIQALFMCLGPAAVFWVTTRDRNPWLTPLALLLFILSGNHYLAYFKLITTTFVSGFVMMAIALGAARRYWGVAVLMAIIGLIHPTYFLVTTGVILFMQWCGSGPCLSRTELIGRLTPLKPCLFVVVPIVGYWLLNSERIVQPVANKELWFTYMQARSDLAFPLRQGILGILEIFCPLLVAGLVFRREGEICDDSRFRSLFGMTLFASALIIVQVLASEVLRSPSLTSLALSHRIQFTFIIACYAGLVAITLRCFVVGQGALYFWIGVLLFVLFGAGLPRSLPISLNVKILGFAIWVYSLQVFEGAKWDLKRKILRCWQVCDWVGIGLVVVLIWGSKSYQMIILVACLMVAELILALRWRGYEQRLGKLKPFVVVGVLLLVMVQYVKATDWKAITGDWHSFLAGDVAEFDTEYRKGRSEYREFIRFITDHVGPTEQILAVPFFLTQSFTPTPYRAMYLDWAESNYVLYMRDYTPKVIEKLATYGIDPEERAPECNLSAMILAKPYHDTAYRCQRRAMQAQAQNKTMTWRNNISKIKELAPKVSWVLIKQDAICNGDRIVASWADFSLMRLDGAVPFADCERRP